jgi:glycosyltransferase involved in cell wall biosynthesis
MRFVFLSYNYSPNINTPQDWVKRINFYVGSLEYLSKTNTVIRIDQINYEGNFIHNGVQYFCLNTKKKKNYFPLKLHRFVKKLKPDVVIVSSFHFPIQIIQLRLVLGNKIKIFIQNHAEKPFEGVKKYLQKLADKYINAYFFVSHEMGKDWLKKGNLASQKKIYEVMEVSSVFHPIDKTEAKSKIGVIGSIVFLWVGRLNENKDPITVIKSFLKFSELYSGANLYVIYQTEELLDEIKKIIKKENRDSIRLIGNIEHKEMLYWYNSSDFIISGSHYEGSGTAVCEAMSCGCIPIATNISAFKMITDNGNCGILYDAGNEQQLLSALIETTRINVEEKKIKSLQQFRKKLSFEAIATKIQEIAESL